MKTVEKISRTESPSPERTSGRQRATGIPAAVGNQAMQRLLRNGTIQAQLTVGRPGDVHEQEADRVASRIISGQPVKAAHGKCAACTTGVPCSKCADHKIQPKTDVAHSSHQDLKSLSQISSRRQGQRLPDSVRSFFEPRFGYNFSDVRIHSHPQGETANQQLSARAFTYGRDIVFATGQYSPDTNAGRMLLAHELTHVIQQSGGNQLPDGGAGSVRPAEPGIQGDGELTEQDMVVIRRWLESDSAPQPDAPLSRPTFGSYFQQLPTRLPGTGPQVGEFSPLNIGRRGPPPGYICNVSCHQSPTEMWEAEQRRQAEARERQRIAAWPGMHRAQHAEDLRQQPGSLREDIEVSELSAAHVRMQLFDRALQQADSTRWLGFFPPAEDLTVGIRDAWAAAQQATSVLNALLAASGNAIPAQVTAPIAQVYRRYYETLSNAFASRDRTDRRLREQVLSNSLRSRTCPTGACHQPSHQSDSLSGTQSFAPSTGLTPNRFSPYVTPLAATSLTPQPTSVLEVATGIRTERLRRAIASVGSATGAESWRGVIADFRWSTTELDSMLRSRLYGDTGSHDLLEQLDFVQQLFQRQQAFLAEHPDARGAADPDRALHGSARPTRHGDHRRRGRASDRRARRDLRRAGAALDAACGRATCHGLRRYGRRRSLDHALRRLAAISRGQ